MKNGLDKDLLDTFHVFEIDFDKLLERNFLLGDFGDDLVYGLALENRFLEDFEDWLGLLDGEVREGLDEGF